MWRIREEREVGRGEAGFTAIIEETVLLLYYSLLFLLLLFCFLSSVGT
jgi:hypothetical protein